MRADHACKDTGDAWLAHKCVTASFGKHGCFSAFMSSFSRLRGFVLGGESSTSSFTFHGPWIINGSLLKSINALASHNHEAFKLSVAD